MAKFTTPAGETVNIDWRSSAYSSAGSRIMLITATMAGAVHGRLGNWLASVL